MGTSSVNDVERGEFIYINPHFLNQLEQESREKYQELKEEYHHIAALQSKYIPRIFALKYDYQNCANFDKSVFKWINKHHLQAIRGLLFNIMFIQFCLNCYVNHKYESIMDMFYYESEWGFIITMIHIGTSMAAAEDRWWQKIAVVTDMKWTGLDLYWRIEMTIVHLIPLAAMIINLTLTDMVFLKKDWRMCFTAGVLYIGADYLGFRIEGHPMYPVVDWKDAKVTVTIFFLQAVLLGLIEYLTALFL